VNLISNYGIPGDEFEFVDGSGGGLTAATNPVVIKMLLEMAARPAFPSFLHSLPILAVDGSLAFVTDFQANPTLAGATGQVSAKSGSFLQQPSRIRSSYRRYQRSLTRSQKFVAPTEG
jgi:D-alanyl-D-alanine carboxypeptidase